MNLNKKAAPLTNPLCVALDVDSKERALFLVDELADIVGGIKLGPRLVLRYGFEFVRSIADRAPVFLDFKYFDIPSTMVAAVQASFDMGVSMVTVHALSGTEALRELAKLEAELNKIRPFKILCVTMLTSFDEKTLPPSLQGKSIRENVKALAQSAVDCGLHSVVCSPEELSLLDTESVYALTPGIRMPMQAFGDQKRVMGPTEAIKAGASAIVVGRPILEAKNAREAATDFITAIYK